MSASAFLSRVRWIALGSALAPALLIAACGSSESSGGQTTATTGSDTPAIVQQARQELEKYRNPVEPPDSEPFKAQRGGRTIGILSCGQQAQACRRMTAAAESAAKLLGYKTIVADGNLTPQGFSAGIDRLVAAKVDGIVKTAAPDAATPESMKRAKDAGIPVACAVCANRAIPPIDAPSIANGDVAYEEQGQALGWYSIAETDGKGIHMFLRNDAITPNKVRWDGFKATYDQCQDCKIISVQLGQATDLIKQARDVAAGQLAKYPPGQLDFITTSDSQMPGVIQAVQTSGRGDDVRLVGFDCEDQALNDVRSGNETACLHSSLDGAAWAAVDQLAREFAGVKTSDVTIGFQLITKDNVPPAGQPVKVYDFPAFYRKVWELS